jgi:hypothetical protein
LANVPFPILRESPLTTILRKNAAGQAVTKDTMEKKTKEKA